MLGRDPIEVHIVDMKWDCNLFACLWHGESTGSQREFQVILENRKARKETQNVFICIYHSQWIVHVLLSKRSVRNERRNALFNRHCQLTLLGSKVLPVNKTAQTLPSFNVWVRRENSPHSFCYHLNSSVRSKKIQARKLCLNSHLKDKKQRAKTRHRVFKREVTAHVKWPQSRKKFQGAFDVKLT